MITTNKKILIVLPTLNEERALSENVKRVFDFCQDNLSNYDWQILIADNGSTDNTVYISQNLTNQHPRITYFHLDQPGRGRAMKKAWLENEADVYLYMDADLATDLKYLPPLIKAITDEGFDLATGSRLKRGAKISRSLFREISSRTYNLILRVIFPKYKIQDSQCGFKAISQRVKIKVLPSVKDPIWFFDTELFIRANELGFKIKEIPVEWQDNKFVKRKTRVKILKTVTDDLREIIKLKIELLKK
ncbi:MAG: glycosyltransferase [Patescibacteria group bacterium]|nr:glycosyltransferase [Patescibacteria group bacterium]MDD5121327.1 glycosyltransferase [Patescibacteria group bacterium]MDD5221812.1 glycosyltransferase [Patescibacteria group bacterium]MDD5395754.1 glycosyltransferase [Patescibacteria group bacterium]